MEPASAEWLGLVVEDIVDPDVPIVDPHHHLWPDGGRMAYGLDDLVADTGSGHDVVATVFVECRAAARPDGPETTSDRSVRPSSWPPAPSGWRRSTRRHRRSPASWHTPI